MADTITTIKVEFHDVYGNTNIRRFFDYEEFKRYLERWNHELTTFNILGFPIFTI